MAIFILHILLTIAFTFCALAQDLKHEHAGGLFGHGHAPSCDTDGVLHNGTSTGVFKTINGESLYLAHPPGPPGRRTSDTAILYLTDIFGVQLVNNRLLADSFARAGFPVVMPDLFRGDPVPVDAMTAGSTFNMTAWRARHPQAQTEAIIASALNSTLNTLGATRMGTVGYCFGGKFVVRLLNQANATMYRIEAGFTAHPSATLLSEWQAVAEPVSVAWGDLDGSNTPQNRSDIQAIFFAGNKTYQTALYGGAAHGFGVRVDLADRKAVLAQESAYFQAVRWLDAWVKGEDA